MKQQIIPFNLERAKNIQEGKELGEIRTTNNKKARIICWNFKGSHDIVVIVEDDGYEAVVLGFNDGKLSDSEYDKLHLIVLSEIEQLEFKLLQPVLVRYEEDDYWEYGEFAFKDSEDLYHTIGGNTWWYCVPYNNLTKSLLGTKNPI